MDLSHLPTRIYKRLSLTLSVLLRGGRGLIPRADIPHLSPDEVEEAQSFFPRPKFFVYGHARSGTTLLMRLIDAHPDVHCSRQAHFFSRPPYLRSLVSDVDVASWLSRGSFRWNRGRDLSPVVMRAAADFILERDAARNGAQIVGDKSPNSIIDGQTIDLTHQIYPDAKIIFIVRDGRDTTLSHRFQMFIDATQHLQRADWRIRAAFERDPERFMDSNHSLFTRKAIREYATGWVHNLETTSERGRALYADRYYELRYEDLLKDSVKETARVWEFLGADSVFPGCEEAVLGVLNDNRDARWQETKAGTFAEKIPKGQRGSWRTFFSARDKEIFKEIAGAALIAYGYESDLDW